MNQNVKVYRDILDSRIKNMNTFSFATTSMSYTTTGIDFEYEESKKINETIKTKNQALLSSRHNNVYVRKHCKKILKRGKNYDRRKSS